jgi:ADP-heptose:LPS heptosyltransferase
VRVVVLRALGLGDLLTAVPALRGVRAAFPDADIALAGPAALAPLLPHGLVDRVVATQALAALDASLAGPDLAVNLHGRGPQSTRRLLEAAPRRLLAFASDEVPETAGAPVWRPDEHEVQRWCRLLTESGVPADPADLHLEAPAVPPAVADAVLVHPGAALPSRRWPEPRWAQVVRGLAGRGSPVLLTGGPEEVERAQRVADLAGLPRQCVVAGRTTVAELAALVAAGRLLVSVDTGVAHLATAFGTPSVVLFGPTPPALWGPPPGAAQHVVLWAGRPGDNFADAVDPGLLALTPADVLRAADNLL